MANYCSAPAMLGAHIYTLILVLHTAAAFNVGGSNGGRLPLDVKSAISQSEECAADFQAVKDDCNKSGSKGFSENNWKVLECLQNMPEGLHLSEACDHYLWKFKLEITQEGFFIEATKVCQSSMADLRMCDQEGIKSVDFISCLVQNKHKTSDPGCKSFLRRIETLIFSDFRLVSKFLHACEGSVDKLECGRTARDHNDPHSQGRTIACLEDKIDEVDEECKNELLGIAELQAENVGLDRALSVACRKEIKSKSICGSEVISDVYDCLMTHKLEPEVSEPCRHEISRREKLISRDYMVSNGLMQACRDDIKKNKCRKEGLDPNIKVGLSHILVCLDEARIEGATIAGACVQQMDGFRKILMSDYSITPELVKDCLHDLRQYCPHAEGDRKGQSIHCLMEVSAANRPGERLEPGCQKTLDNFVREVQMDMDWTADPVFEAACFDVVTAACDPKLGKDGVLSCLMENLARGSPVMTRECRKVLMQIHYFLSREVIIDRHLYASCRKDAKELCDSGDDWHRTQEDPYSKLVFPCLVRNLYNLGDDEDIEGVDDGEDDEDADRGDFKQLSEECSEKVERTLRLRAMSVQLWPPIEQSCREFLHENCIEHTGPGEELSCLQEKLLSLPPKCKKTVLSFSETESRNLYLHPNIIKGCALEINEHCAAEDRAKEGNLVLRCLEGYMIDHPVGRPNGISRKCGTVVENWQILTLKDFHFSFKFKTSCKHDIKKNCRDKHTKFDMVHCLVALVVDDMVNDQQHRIKKACREELKFELLQKHSNLKLNPVLGNACATDFKRLCPNMKGEQAVECLKDAKHSRLSPDCLRALLAEEREEAAINEVDVPLMRHCRKEIQQHCSNANTSSVLDCLSEFAGEFDFDAKCLNVLKRRLKQHSLDVRLNTDLARACHLDMDKYCRDIINADNPGQFHEGKVLFCLKEKYSQNVNLLTRACGRQLQKMIRASNMVSLDPQIEARCPNSLAKCAIGRSKPKDKEGEEEIVIEQECLYKLWVSNTLLDGPDCAESLAIVAESQNRDVKSDQRLFRACSLDLAKFCRDVHSGEGKRFACLVTISKDPVFQLETRCQEIVENRIAMYKVAIKAHPIEQAMELYSAVMQSPDRHYFLFFLLTIVSVIFVFGLCFGRVTKRVGLEIKNR